MKNLAIDIGNSALKWAVFEEGELCGYGRHTHDRSTWAFPEDAEQVSIASVVPVLTEQCVSYCQKQLSNDVRPAVLSTELPCGLSSEYDLKQLGIDRWVNVYLANKQFPKQCTFVVDVGTTVTIDLVREGWYMGGAILPGLQMGLVGLLGAAQLPQLPKILEKPGIVGKNTAQSILSGVYYGLAGAIMGIVYNTQKFLQLPAYDVVLTGHGARVLQEDLEHDIYDEFWTLKGIDALREHPSS